MKKLKIFAVLFFLICTITAFVGCGDKLDAPKRVSVQVSLTTDQEEVSWAPVEDAYRYLVQFKDVDSGDVEEQKTKERKIAVSEFDLEEGWYEIRVKALSGEDSDNDSVWSSPFDYYKIYESGCSFTLVNNVEYHVTGSEKAKGDVIIETEYKGKPVTPIADRAFNNNTRITSVTFGDYVTKIEERAFYGCSLLKEITFPEGLQTIGDRAFYSCRELTSLEIPNQVTQIGEYAFTYARKLKTLTLGQSVQTIGNSAFYGCSELEKIEIPDSVELLGDSAFANCTVATSVVIGKGVKQIGQRAFYQNTELAEISFVKGIKLNSIGDYAFAHATKVKKVELPDSVTYLGDSVFQGCSDLFEIDITKAPLVHIGSYAFGATKYYINQVEAQDQNQGLYYLGDWLIGTSEDDDDSDDVDNSFKGKTESITPETFYGRQNLVGIADSALERCIRLVDVELPESVKYVGDYAFYHCKKLNLVTMHEVLTVGDYAFAEDENLSQLRLGNKLLEIGSYAFYNCGALENNSLNPIVPSTVRRIGTYAFQGSGLWDNPSEDGLIYAGSWVVGYMGAITDVEIQDGTVGIADYAFFMAVTLKTVSNIGSAGVKYIGRGAFALCLSLGTITLSDEMETIEDYTFYQCANLLNVTLPQSLKTVGRSAFYECKLLTEVDFEETLYLEKIDDFAFAYCQNLGEVNFGWSLETIGNYAFYKCYSLETVELPATVETIGDYAFYNNYFTYAGSDGELVQKGLKKVVFDKDLSDSEESALKTIGDYAFTGCKLLESVELPDSVVSLGTSAFYECISVTKVSLGKNLETIGDYAFYGLEKVTLLELPETVKSIGMYAFKGWEGLVSVMIPENVELIGEHAFYGCKNATIYTDCLPDQVNWDIRWNSSYRPVVFGVTFTENEHYLSLAIAENTFAYLREDSEISAPVRPSDGEFEYKFAGWATSENGSVVYAANEIAELPVGTTLYAVWDKSEIVQTEEPTE